MGTDFNNLSFNDLEAFLEVCETGSTTLAAKKRKISPQGIRKILQKIERHYQTKLYYRSPGSFQLTAQGILIEKTAKQILSQMKNLEQSVLEMNHRRGSFHISFGDGLLRFLTPEWLENLREKCGDIHFTYTEQKEAVLIQELSEPSGPDLGVCVGVGKLPPSLRQIGVLETKIYAVLDAEHPLAGKTELSPAELISFPFIPPPQESHSRLLWETLCESEDLRCSPAYESSQFAPELVLGNQMILLSDGFHLGGSSEDTRQWKYIPLDPTAPSVRLCILHRKNDVHPQTEQVRILFMQYVQTMKRDSKLAYRFLGGMAKIPGGFNTTYRAR